MSKELAIIKFSIYTMYNVYSCLNTVFDEAWSVVLIEKKHCLRVTNIHIIAPCTAYLKVLFLSEVLYLSMVPKVVQGFVVLGALIGVSQVTNMSKKVQNCHISPKGKVHKKNMKFFNGIFHEGGGVSRAINVFSKTRLFENHLRFIQLQKKKSGVKMDGN